jgi:heptosyltransferase-2
MALFLEDPAAHLFPSAQDRADATSALGERTAGSLIALHPGSGGERKNWPLDRWVELTTHFLTRGRQLLVIGGESDTERILELRTRLPASDSVRFVEHLPLPVLAALLSRCALFVGHDSGISHIAAAAGTRCVLLFGPTDPTVWAPANAGVQVVASPSGLMDDIALDSVRTMVDSVLANV